MLMRGRSVRSLSTMVPTAMVWRPLTPVSSTSRFSRPSAALSSQISMLMVAVVAAAGMVTVPDGVT